MPRIKLMSRTTATVSMLYLNDESVGAGGANRRKDVLLMQFLLRTLQSTKVVFEGKEFDYRLNGELVSIDGACGNQTISHIRNFQTVHDQGADMSSAGAMLRDGRVDAMKGNQPVGPRQGHVLTIVRLNQEYVIAYGQKRHTELFNDPLFPKELMDEFFA